MTTDVTLTPRQIEAINSIDGNLQILAGAGSGKTEVVAERIVTILEKKGSEGIRPLNIVAFTFTDRAAAELKERISQKVASRLGNLPGMADMYVGTIHGFCLQLLQNFIPEYFKYSVLTDVQARLLVDRYPAASGLYKLNLKRWRQSDLYLRVLAILREAKVNSTVLGNHPANSALEQYQSLLHQHRYFDFTEIMYQAVQALQDDAQLRQQVSEQIKYLTVDEYQDVNPLQEALVHVLHDLGANVCVVGDDDPTIYQWRGSTVENILHFSSRYPNVTQISILENWRSSPGVVDTAALVISHNDPNRLKKVMVSGGSQQFENGDVLCMRFSNPEEEAHWIANKAKSLIGTPFIDKPGDAPRGLAPSDIAVLLRSVRQSAGPIVKALQDVGLPPIVGGMATLFRTSEVQAAVRLFEFMAGQASTDDLSAAWQEANLGVDPNRLKEAISVMEARRIWDQSKLKSEYGLQRTFLIFLEGIELREEKVPNARGEVVYYNLGKFSQVISDYEQINFNTPTQEKYERFVGFLRFQAPTYYPEGWQESSYVKPDAVQIMTVHQAKGMEWPVVFIPALQGNKFPLKKPGGTGPWHVIPRTAIDDAERYDGSHEDERRLFYVALTRSKKHLFSSWAPDSGNQLYRQPSMFVSEVTSSNNVLTKEPSRPPMPKLEPKPKREVVNVTLNFSELKYYFDCPYEFKLRFLYGFNPPIVEFLGYGKSLHDALAEVHKRALNGDIITEEEAATLIERHIHLPFGYDQLEQNLKKAGAEVIQRYLQNNRHVLDKVEHVEQVIEVNLGQGVIVNGRIDLIKRLDTNEVIIVDFKSSNRAQEEDVSRTQLHIYTLGYRDLVGKAAQLIEIYDLEHGISEREEVNIQLEEDARKAILEAGSSLRSNTFPRLPTWGLVCTNCDFKGICRQRHT